MPSGEDDHHHYLDGDDVHIEWVQIGAAVTVQAYIDRVELSPVDLVS